MFLRKTFITRYKTTTAKRFMTQQTPPIKNPLQGVTLEAIVTRLEGHYGWDELGRRINIRCFQSDPSVKSSLKFLRRTPWAREQVEQLFINTFY